jgi:hypothetical protein
VLDHQPVSHHELMSDTGNSEIGWIREIVLNSADPHGLANFWSGLVGGASVEWYPGWVTLEPPPNGQRLSFQGTGGHSGQAGWTAAGSGVHFDVLVGDLDTAHERVGAAGAIYVAEHVSPRPGPGGEQIRWRVYQDPAGHPFCLVTR